MLIEITMILEVSEGALDLLSKFTESAILEIHDDEALFYDEGFLAGKCGSQDIDTSTKELVSKGLLDDVDMSWHPTFKMSHLAVLYMNQKES